MSTASCTCLLKIKAPVTRTSVVFCAGAHAAVVVGTDLACLAAIAGVRILALTETHVVNGAERRQPQIIQ